MSVSSETLEVVINFSDKEPTHETFNKLLTDLAAINGGLQAARISEEEFKDLEFYFQKYGSEKMANYCELYSLEVLSGNYASFSFSELLRFCKEFD
ncbi:MAG: hypothetical protein KGO93_08205 [Cyanobacteria bacterium REEB446]|nr:hypothetical protein [Cyanobacteria bacterium REEB446]